MSSHSGPPPLPPPPLYPHSPGDAQCCHTNCDFCFGRNSTYDLKECFRPLLTRGDLYCPATKECWQKCCSAAMTTSVGSFLLCKECRDLMNGCAGCLENAGEACSAECIQFKINMKRAIERRQLRTPPVAANTMSPPGVQRPQSARYAELGGKKYKSRGLRRRKSKSKLSGLRRRKSKSKSRGLRRRKTMTSRG
jgi:hypothetical protein